ncbi:hypothetical protein [Pseudoxanthomonas mexicana]
MTDIIVYKGEPAPRIKPGQASETHLLLRALVNLLGAYNYRYGSELQLHATLSQVLSEAGHEHVREYQLDAHNRADFWLPMGEKGLVIEVKVDGTIGDALRQVSRYAGFDQVNGVLLVSTCRWASRENQGTPVTGAWGGKPCDVAYLQRQAL